MWGRDAVADAGMRDGTDAENENHDSSRTCPQNSLYERRLLKTLCQLIIIPDGRRLDTDWTQQLT